MAFYSPLRYPGGKGKIANYIKIIFELNELLDGHYIEVYAGGAAIAIELLIQEYASHIYINDFNKSIHAFWFCVLNETEALCKLIADTPVTMDTWHKQKNIQNNPNEVDILSLGFSTFFLNRTNRSGIINGGVIGGKKQSSTWKLDARYNVKDLTKRIKRIAQYKNRISLYNIDAVDFIRTELPKLPVNALVYLDPPYYFKGKGLYDSYYTHENHVMISETISASMKQQKWIVSYDNVPQIHNLYNKYRKLEYSLNYSAANRYKGSEVIFFCDDLLIPNITNPVMPNTKVHQPLSSNKLMEKQNLVSKHIPF